MKDMVTCAQGEFFFLKVVKYQLNFFSIPDGKVNT